MHFFQDVLEMFYVKNHAAGLCIDDRSSVDYFSYTTCKYLCIYSYN